MSTSCLHLETFRTAWRRECRLSIDPPVNAPFLSDRSPSRVTPLRPWLRAYWPAIVKLGHMIVCPNTCWKAFSYTLSNLSFSIIGMASLALGMLARLGCTRLSGMNVIRPDFSFCNISMTLVAVSSLSTTQWKRLCPAVTSTARRKRSSTSSSSANVPYTPSSLCRCFIRRTAARLRLVFWSIV